MMWKHESIQLCKGLMETQELRHFNKIDDLNQTWASLQYSTNILVHHCVTMIDGEVTHSIYPTQDQLMSSFQPHGFYNRLPVSLCARVLELHAVLPIRDRELLSMSFNFRSFAWAKIVSCTNQLKINQLFKLTRTCIEISFEAGHPEKCQRRRITPI